MIVTCKYLGGLKVVKPQNFALKESINQFNNCYCNWLIRMNSLTLQSVLNHLTMDSSEQLTHNVSWGRKGYKKVNTRFQFCQKWPQRGTVEVKTNSGKEDINFTSNLINTILMIQAKIITFSYFHLSPLRHADIMIVFTYTCLLKHSSHK